MPTRRQAADQAEAAGNRRTDPPPAGRQAHDTPSAQTNRGDEPTHQERQLFPIQVPDVLLTISQTGGASLSVTTLGGLDHR